MSHSLMNIPGRPGSISLEARYQRKYCFGPKSSKLLWRTRQERRSRYFGQTMGVSILPMHSMIFVDRRGSRGSLQFLTLHKIMEWMKGRGKPIVGAARAMLHYHSFPFFLWAEACSNFVYVLNMSLHHSLG